MQDTPRSGIRKTLELNKYYRENADKIPKLRISTLDDIVRLYKGMHTVAARSSIGKSSFMRKASYNQLEDGLKVGILSLEMSIEELMAGYVSMLTDIPFREVMEESPCRHRSEAFKRVGEFDDQLRVSSGRRFKLSEISKIIDGWVEWGVDVVWIDYLTRIVLESQDTRRGVNDIIYGLSDICNKHNLPIVTLAQLNRGAAGTRPAMQYLQESSLIEQESKTIILLDRYMKTDADDEHRKYNIGGNDRVLHETEAVALIVKNRFGDTGIRRIKWVGKGSYFH